MGLIEVCCVVLGTAIIGIVFSAIADWRADVRREIRSIRDEYRS